MNLLDSIKLKDSEIQKLIQEQKTLKNQLEEHKKCELKNDIHFFRRRKKSNFNFI